MLGGRGIKCTAVATGLRTLRHDGVGTRGNGRAGFGERRRTGEPGDAAGFDLGDEFVRKRPMIDETTRGLATSSASHCAAKSSGVESPASAGTAGPHCPKNFRTSRS
jgi:hypothetical protein